MAAPMEPKTLAEVLKALPEEERIILTLSYLRGMDSGQIATLLQVPQKSVEAVIASGKARLTAQLGL
jgi:DNA-directed RNA polymerase specialized sigma24 family protein